MAASEYNASPPEYTHVQEYGATAPAASARRRRSSARQRALMQATAAVMTVVAVTAAAPSIAPRAAGEPSGIVSEQPAAEAQQPSAAATQPESAGPTLTAEEQAFLDELAAACRAEDDAAIYTLMHNALFEPLAEKKIWRLPAYSEDPLSISYRGDASGSTHTVRYLFRDDPAAKNGGRVLYLNLITGSDGREMPHLYVLTDEGPADAPAITAARGYCKSGTILPGADYASLEQGESYYEMTGEFASGSVPSGGTYLFLENGTLVTGMLTAYDGLPPLTFEVRDGYLQPGGQLTVERIGDDFVHLNHLFTLDGTEYGRGISTYFNDDPYYHTPLQQTFL